MLSVVAAALRSRLHRLLPIRPTRSATRLRSPIGRFSLPLISAAATVTAGVAPGYVVIVSRAAAAHHDRGGIAAAVAIATVVLIAFAAAATYLVATTRTTARPHVDVRRVLVGGAFGTVAGLVSLVWVRGISGGTIIVGLAGATIAAGACATFAYAAHRRAGAPPNAEIAGRRARRRDIGIAGMALAVAALAWHSGPTAAVIVPSAVAIAIALGVGAAVGPLARWLGGRAVRAGDEAVAGQDAGVWADMMVVGADLVPTTTSVGAYGVARDADERMPDHGRAAGGAVAATGTHAVIAAVAYLGRRPGVHRVAALATAAAILVGASTFAWMSASEARHDRAAIELGADRVLTIAPTSASHLLSAVRAADPAGRYAMAVVKLPSGPGRPPVVAVDASRLGAIEPTGTRGGPDGSALAALIEPGQPEPASVTGLGLQLNASAAGNLGTGIRVIVLLNLPNGTTRGAIFGPLREGEHVYVAEAPCPEGCTVAGFSVVADGGPTGPPGIATASVVLRELRQRFPDRTVLGTASFGNGTRWNVDAVQPAGRGALGASEVGLVVTVPVPAGSTGIVSTSLDSAVPIAAVSAPGGPATGAIGDILAVRTVRTVAAPPGVPAGGLLVDLDAMIRAALATGADLRDAFESDAAPPSSGASDEVWLAADAPQQVVSALGDQGLDVERSITAADIADVLSRPSSVAIARFDLVTAVVAFWCAVLLIGAATRAHRGSRTVARGLGLATTTWFAGIGGAIVARVAGPDPATSFADGWRLLPAPSLIGASALVSVAAVTAAVLSGTVLGAALGSRPDPGTFCPPGKKRRPPTMRGAGDKTAMDGPRTVSR